MPQYLLSRVLISELGADEPVFNLTTRSLDGGLRGHRNIRGYEEVEMLRLRG